MNLSLSHSCICAANLNSFSKSWSIRSTHDLPFSLLSKVSGLRSFSVTLVVLVLGDLLQEVSHVQQIGFVSSHHRRLQSLSTPSFSFLFLPFPSFSFLFGTLSVREPFVVVEVRAFPAQGRICVSEEFDVGEVEAELQAGPLSRDRLLPLSRADDVGRYLLSRGRLALGAGFPFFDVDFDGSSVSSIFTCSLRALDNHPRHMSVRP